MSTTDINERSDVFVVNADWGVRSPWHFAKTWIFTNCSVNSIWTGISEYFWHLMLFSVWGWNGERPFVKQSIRFSRIFQRIFPADVGSAFWILFSAIMTRAQYLMVCCCMHMSLNQIHSPSLESLTFHEISQSLKKKTVEDISESLSADEIPRLPEFHSLF